MTTAPNSSWELSEDLHRCPTCGRFVSGWDGFTDVEPGGQRGHDFCAVYCNAGCAAGMDPPALCENHGKPHCVDLSCACDGPDKGSG